MPRSHLPVRQYPKLSNTVITVTTIYPGASAELMQGFITTPIEQAVASADGIDYMTSQLGAGHQHDLRSTSSSIPIRTRR